MKPTQENAALGNVRIEKTAWAGLAISKNGMPGCLKWIKRRSNRN